MKDGEVLKAIRILKNLSQEGVAKSLGISQQMYSKYERATELNNAFLPRILEALKSNIEEFEFVKKFRKASFSL